MNAATKDEIRKRLRAGERATDVANALGVARWQVEHQRSFVRSGVSLELEPGDRVMYRDGDFAWIVKVLRRGCRLKRGRRSWYASYSMFYYAPTPAEQRLRAEKIREASLLAFRQCAV